MQVVPVLFGIVLVVFMVVRLIPGDPARIMLGMRATEERLAALRTELGLDLPIWQQFGLFVGNILQGDLGTSLFYRRDVTGGDPRTPARHRVAGRVLGAAVGGDLPAAGRSPPPCARARGSTRWCGALDPHAVPAGLLGRAEPAHPLRRPLPVFPIAGFGAASVDILWHLTLPRSRSRCRSRRS
jgi:peptide/nickel transport system permease protein